MDPVFYQAHNSVGNYNYNIFIYEPCEYAHHFHKNYELVYVMEGRLEIQVDGKDEIMDKGQFLLVLPNCIHSYRSSAHNKVWICVFSKDYVADFAKIVHGKERAERLFRCSPSEMAYLNDVLLLENNELSLVAMKAGLYMVCNRYLSCDKWVSRQEKDGKIAHKVIDYVENNFRRDLSLMEVADFLGYEYHYFSKTFRNIFRMSFKTFLNQYRFDYAKNMILKTDLDLSTIAMESGFGSLRNFNRIYKLIAGSTPREHRIQAIQSKIPNE